MNNRWDGELNGIKFRLRRGQGAYSRFFSRQQVEEQFILPAGGRTSRADRRTTLQTSWAEGATWFRPLLSEATRGTYQYSTGINAWGQAGNLVGQNAVTSNTPASRGMSTTIDYCPMITAPFGGQISTIVGVSTTNDLRYWNGSAWADSTQVFTGAPWDIAYSPSEERIYGMTSSLLRWVAKDDGSSGSISSIFTTGNPYYGASLIVGPLGKMHVYDGEMLRRVDAAGTGLEAVTDDGFGADILENMSNTNGTISAYSIRLATSSSEGVYYIKNVDSGEGPSAWLFRVERDAAGNIISVPIATLPVGALAISIGYAFGAPMIVTTYEWEKALENDGSHFQTEIWSVFGGTLGLLGSINIQDPANYGTAEPVATLGTFLGVDKNLVLFGATDGVWGYDTVRGGIHKVAATTPAVGTETAYLKWYGQGKILFSNTEMADPMSSFDLPTSTLGTDDTTMTLWSNWFDFDLPNEDKTITAVKTITDETGNAATNQWRVYIIDDEGTSTDISHNHVNTQEHETTGLSITGRRFLYRLIYETTAASAQPAVLTDITVTAQTGETVQGWRLTIDGSEFRNVENEHQDPEAVYDNWVTLGQNEAAITFLDSFEAYDRDDETSHTVKIESIQIQKEDPNEAMIEVVLIDAS